jgi:hypothetical protein
MLVAHRPDSAERPIGKGLIVFPSICDPPTDPATNHWKTREALLLAFAAALAAGLYVQWYYSHHATWSDIDQIWIGARALLDGREPYAAVRNGFPWPLYYPVPALLVGLPLAAFSQEWARVLFGFATMCACTWAVARHRPHALPVLATGPFLYAIQRGQWAPLLIAAALIPALGGLLLAKPSTGLALFVWKPTRAVVIGGVALVLASLVIAPSWPEHWISAFTGTRHLLPPVLLVGGWGLLLALRNWRDPGARLLAAIALVPQTPTLYEVCILALIPQTRRRALVLAISFNVLYLLTAGLNPRPPLEASTLAVNFVPARWPYMVLLGYLPALAMVLWPPRKQSPPAAPAIVPDLAPQGDAIGSLTESGEHRPARTD